MLFFQSRLTHPVCLLKNKQFSIIALLTYLFSLYLQPSKVARLVVVDISPIIPTTGGRPLDFFPKVLAVMTSVDFTGMDTLNKAKAAAKKKLLESQLFPDEGSMYFILMNVGQLPDKSFGWKCNVISLQKNFDNIVSFPYMAGKKYKGSTLFVGGRLSNFIP